MKSNALLVALGILLSRIAGLIRVRVFAHYFGNSDAGDAFNAALKIPNFLQNLLGEGVLSASFIPVYARLLAEKNNEDAGKVASVIGSLLFLLTSFLVMGGVLLTPFMIDFIAPGFSGEKRALTISIVQILFPGTGFLVMSAWCLGILNSHKKFFLSYVAPVIWNASIIAALVIWGSSSTPMNLAIIVAWGLVAGSFLQFAVQFPLVLRLSKGLRPRLHFRFSHVQVVLKNFVPVVISRGVVQVSAYIDNMLASFLPTGAVSSLAYAQTLYLLPVSLFGMSISVAELPEMSQALGNTEQVHEILRTRLQRGLAQIAFFIVPSVVAFLTLGDYIVGAIFQTGEFNADNTKTVWFVLIGSTVGLLATTLGRLYSSTFYSLKDTRTPLRFAMVRVAFTTILGALCGLYLPGLLGVDKMWGTCGLTASAGVAGWIEFYFLRRALNKKIGKTGLQVRFLVQLWALSFASTLLPNIIFRFWLTDSHFSPLVKCLVTVTLYGLHYFAFSYALGIEQARKLVERVSSKLGRLSK